MKRLAFGKLCFEKIWASIMVMLVLLQLMPLSAFALSMAPPAERVIAQNGKWMFDSDVIETGQTKIWTCYTGDKDQKMEKQGDLEISPAQFTFTVNEKVKLSRIHAEYNRLPKSMLDNDPSSAVPREAKPAKSPPTASTNAKSSNQIKEGEVLVSIDDSVDKNRGVGPSDNTSLTLKDESGKKLGTWPVQLEFAGISGETPPKNAAGVAIMEDDEIIVKPGVVYTVELKDVNKSMYNAETGYLPAVAVIGQNYSAWKKYMALLLEAQKKKEQEEKKQKGKATSVEVGQIMVSEAYETPYKPQKQDIPNTARSSGKLKPAEFSLEEEKLIDEIQTDHFNGGKGTAPGTFQIISETEGNNKTYGPFQSKGGKLADVENGVWISKPKVVLPAGKYKLVDSSPDTISYDPATLQPDFYVRIVDAPKFNFTGTYFISVKTICTSSMNKSKIGQPTSFDRDNYELAVIDKGDYMEVIGKYTQEKKKDPFAKDQSTQYDFKDVPFSQICEITSRDAVRANMAFKLSLDLTNLPYKAKVTIDVPFKFDSSDGTVKLTASGSSNYSRSFSEAYGGDNNSYSVNATGYRVFEQLPDYVRFEQMKVKNIGNIPGPDSDTEGAVGTLFPPLAALILQIAFSLKKHRKVDPEPENDSGEGSGSDGDTGDGSSGGDGGSSQDDGSGKGSSGSDDGGSGDSGSGDSGGDNQNSSSDNSSTSSDDKAPGAEKSPDGGDKTTTEPSKDGSDPSKDSGATSTTEPGKEADPSKGADNTHSGLQEPLNGDEKTVHDFGDGKDKTYIYDASTKKWTNPLTGAEYDPDAYASAQKTYEDDTKRAADYKQFLDNVKAEGPDKFLAEVIASTKARVKAMDQLQSMAGYFRDNNVPDDGPISMSDRVDKAMKDLSEGNKSPDEIMSQIDKFRKYAQDSSMGRIGTQSQADLAATGLGELSVAMHGIANTGYTIGSTVGGVFVDGATGKSWTGLGVRLGAAIVTGGASEAVYMGTSIAINANNYMQGKDGKPGDSAFTAVVKATGLEVGSMLLGMGIFKVGGATVKGVIGGMGIAAESALGSLGYTFKPSITLPPVVTETAGALATKLSNAYGATKNALTTDLSELLGTGAKGASKGVGAGTKTAVGEALGDTLGQQGGKRAPNPQSVEDAINQAQNQVKNSGGMSNRNAAFTEGRIEGAKKVDNFNQAFEDYQKNPTHENEIRVKQAAAEVQQDLNAKHVMNDMPEGAGDGTRKNFNQTIENGNRNIEHRQTNRINQEYEGIPDEATNQPPSKAVKVTNAKDGALHTVDAEGNIIDQNGKIIDRQGVDGYAKKTGNETIPNDGPFAEGEKIAKPNDPVDVKTKSVSYDNDATHRVRQEVVDPRSGKTKIGYADVKEADLARIRNQELYREYHNGELPKSPDGTIDMEKVDHYAEKMDYHSGDRLSTESYDNSDKGLKTATSKSPTIKGRNFNDVEAVAKTMEYKSNHPYDMAMTDKAEAAKAFNAGDYDRAQKLMTLSETHLEESMRQTTKQFDSQLMERIKIAQTNSGGRTIQVAGELQDAINVMKRVGSGPGMITPAEAEQALRLLGTDSQTVAAKVAANLESLQKFK